MYSDIEGLPHDRIVPTVGLNIGRIEASNTKLVFWDLGGQVRALIGNTIFLYKVQLLYLNESAR